MKLRTDNQSLKAELERTTRALQKEVGDSANVDDILREDSNWKGRAQKLSILKDQIK
jgi:hypothetical protein